MTRTDDFEPPHAASSTAHVLAELQMYGYRPFEDEPDPRPLPEAPRIGGVNCPGFCGDSKTREVRDSHEQ